PSFFAPPVETKMPSLEIKWLSFFGIFSTAQRIKSLVPERGLDPPLPCENYLLKLARLPFPPFGHCTTFALTFVAVQRGFFIVPAAGGLCQRTQSSRVCDLQVELKPRDVPPSSLQTRY